MSLVHIADRLQSYKGVAIGSTSMTVTFKMAGVRAFFALSEDGTATSYFDFTGKLGRVFETYLLFSL